MKKNKIVITLGLITGLALLLRLYRLDLMPLYTDETGGHFYYYWLQSHFSLWQNPLNLIMGKIVSLTWMLGLNEWGVRVPAAILSSLLAGGMYWWITGLSHNMTTKKNSGFAVAALSAFLVAVLPWSFMIGRIGHGFVPLMLLSLMGSLGFFLRGKLVRAMLLLILGSYFYPSMILVSFFLFILYFGKILNDKKLTLDMIFSLRIVILCGIFLVVLIGLFVYKYNGFSPHGRGLDLAIWRDVNVTAETNEQRGIARTSEVSVFSLGLPTERAVNKLFLSKLTAVMNEFGQRYWSFWTPEWLFIKGDPILRHSTGMNGQFWWWLAPFMLIGAFVFFNNEGKSEKSLVGIILLASPIPAAITNDGTGYLLRAITMLPFLTLFCALGIVAVVEKLKSKTWRLGYLMIIVSLIFFSSWNFYFKYFHIYPVMAAKSFEDGWRELSRWQKTNEEKPLLVIWKGFYPDTAFRFWQKNIDKDFKPQDPEILYWGESEFYKTNDNLYFSWPENYKDLIAMQKNLRDVYLVFPNKYLDENPEYKYLLKEKIAVIDGKYLEDVFEIWSMTNN